MMFKGKLGQGLGGMASLAGGVKNKAQQGLEGAKTHAKETVTTHPNNNGNLFLYLALIIFILDFIGGQYTGFKWMWGAGNIELAVNILTSSVFATWMLIYVLIKVMRKDWTFVGFDTFIFVFFAFVMTFFILNNQWFGGGMQGVKAGIHFAYILFFGFTFMKTNESDISTVYMWVSIFLLLDFFGYSLLQNVLILRYLPIILIFSAFYVYQKSQSKVSTFFLVGIIIIMFIFAYQDVTASDDDTLFIPQDVGGGFNAWFSDFKKGGKALVSSWQAGFQRQIQFAITGKVEENEYEPLGVYLENVQPTAPRYYIDKGADDKDRRFEEVIIWGTLRGRTLDDPINIEVGCYVEKGREKIRAGKEDPEHNFTIFALEEQDFACTFTSDQLETEVLKKGSNIITTFANFNFETLAYLRVYFINRERQRAMVREGLDVFDELGIVDRNPVPVFTNGPVAVEMGTTSPLVGVSESYIASPRFSLAIKNRQGWEGRITGLRELVLLFPEGVEIENPGFDDKGEPDKKDCNVRFKDYGIGDCRDSDCNPLDKDCNKEVSCNRVGIDCINVCEGYLYPLDPDNPNKGVRDKENCEEFCNEKFKECNEQCEFLFIDGNQEYKGYALAQSEIDLIKERVYKDDDAQKFERFNCKIRPKLLVLENTPITTKFIRVKTRYDYTLEKPVSVSIVEVPTIDQDDKSSSKTELELISAGYDDKFAKRATQFSDAVKLAVDSSQGICRVEFDKYPALDEQQVQLGFSSGKLTVGANARDKEYVELQDQEGYEAVGYKPCIVHGRNFWEWLWNRGEGNQVIEQATVQITGQDDKDLIAHVEGGDWVRYNLFPARPLIYKVGKHICLVPTFDDKFNSDCDIDDEEIDGKFRNYVDNDCFRDDNLDRGKRIPECKVSGSLPFDAPSLDRTP